MQQILTELAANLKYSSPVNTIFVRSLLPEVVSDCLIFSKINRASGVNLFSWTKEINANIPIAAKQGSAGLSALFSDFSITDLAKTACLFGVYPFFMHVDSEGWRIEITKQVTSKLVAVQQVVSAASLILKTEEFLHLRTLHGKVNSGEEWLKNDMPPAVLNRMLAETVHYNGDAAIIQRHFNAREQLPEWINASPVAEPVDFPGISVQMERVSDTRVRYKGIGDGVGFLLRATCCALSITRHYEIFGRSRSFSGWLPVEEPLDWGIVRSKAGNSLEFVVLCGVLRPTAQQIAKPSQEHAALLALFLTEAEIAMHLKIALLVPEHLSYIAVPEGKALKIYSVATPGSYIRTSLASVPVLRLIALAQAFWRDETTLLETHSYVNNPPPTALQALGVLVSMYPELSQFHKVLSDNRASVLNESGRLLTTLGPMSDETTDLDVRLAMLPQFSEGVKMLGAGISAQLKRPHTALLHEQAHLMDYTHSDTDVQVLVACGIVAFSCSPRSTETADVNYVKHKYTHKLQALYNDRAKLADCLLPHMQDNSSGYQMDSVNELCAGALVQAFCNNPGVFISVAASIASACSVYVKKRILRDHCKKISRKQAVSLGANTLFQLLCV